MTGQASPPSVLDAVAQVEALAAAVYADAMGRDWPVPYSALKVSEQEEWRGKAYCATYALALCPVTKTVHPWLRSWCEPSCRPAGNAPPKPYLCGCPASDPRPCPLHENAQPGGPS